MLGQLISDLVLVHSFYSCVTQVAGILSWHSKVTDSSCPLPPNAVWIHACYSTQIFLAKFHWNKDLKSILLNLSLLSLGLKSVPITEAWYYYVHQPKAWTTQGSCMSLGLVGEKCSQLGGANIFLFKQSIRVSSASEMCDLFYIYAAL